MSILSVLIYLLFLIVLGLPVLCMSTTVKMRLGLKDLPLAFFSGMGIQGFLFFYASYLGFIPTPKVMMIFAVPAIAVSIFIWRRKCLDLCLIDPDSRLRSSALWIFIGFLLITFLLILYSQVSLFYRWDAYAVWGIKGKVLATESLRETTFFSNLLHHYNHVDYPFLHPLMISVFYGLSGEFNELGIKLFFPLSYLMLMVFLYHEFRRLLKPSLVFTLCILFIALTPELLIWSTTGHAELSLVCHYTLSIAFILRWMKSGEIRDIIIASLFAAFLLFTKNEGMVIFAILVLVVLVQCLKNKAQLKKDFPLFVLLPIVLLVPYMMWSYNLDVENVYTSQLTGAAAEGYLARLPIIIKTMAVELLNIRRWSLLFPLLLCLLIMNRTQLLKDKRLQMLLMMLGLHLLGYATVYMISPNDVVWHMQTSLQRLILHVTPAAFFILIICLNEDKLGSK
ncbi:glycosyltransferase family 39 protein [bacterium AH-315-E10]|nr:glycosyltransferase family 39 protein [bacterium AH-315-E10]